jgi:GTPase
MAEVSRQLGRQVGVLLDRDGTVDTVVVGDATRLSLPDIGRLRGGVGRFRGLRLVHTHLRGEPLTADDMNDLALLRLDLVAAVESTAEGSPGRIEVAMLAPDGGAEAEAPFRRWVARDVHGLDLDFGAEIRAVEDQLARVQRALGEHAERERALVIGVSPHTERFRETIELARSAGVDVAFSLRQRRTQLQPSTVVGRGKLMEIVLEGMRHRASVAIFDIDLRPAQARGFEDATGLKVVDRTQLILDIFAQRARSRDGKLQVELAQLRYSLPRLTEKDAGLSRLTGGIGGRGPGETVMEIGRRRIRDRIRSLERQIERLSVQRDLRRRRRRQAGIPVLAIVGYTNVGKSTLLNALTDSRVETADRLFMTLDPTTRRLRFPREGEVVISDTVGFIRDLPKDLVAAFRATLEELADADLLLHVQDAADERIAEHGESVERLLEELDLGNVPRLSILNKCDLVPPAQAETLARRFRAVPVSAALRAGLDRLVAAAEAALSKKLGSEARPGQEGPPGA